MHKSYVEITHICGNYIERERYFCQNNYIASENRARVPRDKTKKTTKEREYYNNRKSETRTRRSANTNFTEDDLHVTLTATTFKNLEEFSKMMTRFLERLRYHFRVSKLGKLKYIYSYGEHAEKSKDNKFGVHSHIIMSGMSTDELEKIWKKDKDAGHIQFSKLRFDNKGGIGGLIAYFMRNVQELKKKHRERGEGHKVENMRAYNPSRNLDKPKKSNPKYITRKQMQEQPKARKGFVITDVENIPTSYGIYQLIHIMKITNMKF